MSSGSWSIITMREINHHSMVKRQMKFQLESLRLFKLFKLLSNFRHCSMAQKMVTRSNYNTNRVFNDVNYDQMLKY